MKKEKRKMDCFMWIDKDDTFEGRRMEAKLAVEL